MIEGTKERILRIALELFAQNVYLGTSMNDIAGQLGFTKAALYKHYSSKQDEYYVSNVPLFRRNGYRQSGTMIP